MRNILLIIVVMGLTLSALAMNASAATITAEHIEGDIYSFSIQNYSGGIRWSFGDGATSTELEPVHEYIGQELYLVVAELENGDVVNLTVDNRPELLDEDSGTMNVDSVSIPGGFLLVSCSIMFIMAKSDAHPFAAVLGRGGKDIVMFFYFLGIMAGGYLVFMSIYPNGGV